MADITEIVAGNAAGTVKTLADVEKLCRSEATRITVGSITFEERPGNSGDTYYFDYINSASINALGLPNMGIAALVKSLPQMLSLAHQARKELWVSAAGFGADEFTELATACFRGGVDGVELNLGCPNVHDGGVSKPIFSYDPSAVDEVLARVEEALDVSRSNDYRRSIGMKISPVPDDILADLIDVINKRRIVREVVAVNTEPNQTLSKPGGSPALSFVPPGGSEKKHVGGLAGMPLCASGMRVVKGLREGLSGDIGVIAAGGIFTALTAKQYLDYGASGFECATAYLERGPGVFVDILSDLMDL